MFFMVKVKLINTLTNQQIDSPDLRYAGSLSLRLQRKKGALKVSYLYTSLRGTKQSLCYTEEAEIHNRPASVEIASYLAMTYFYRLLSGEKVDKRSDVGVMSE
jgi:hypothetical protein